MVEPYKKDCLGRAVFLFMISENYLTSISISSIFSNPFLIFLTPFFTLIPQIIIAIAQAIIYIHTRILNVRVVNNELQAMNNQINVISIHRIRTQYHSLTFSFLISKLSIIIITHLTAIAIHNTATNTKIMNSHAQGKHNSNNHTRAVSRELTPINVLSSNHGFLIANAIPAIQKIKA